MDNQHPKLKKALPLIWAKRYMILIVVIVISGLVGSAFALATQAVTALRLSHPTFLFGLPFGAMMITFVYKRADMEKDSGTIGVLSAAQNGYRVPLRQGVLIFFAATLSHTFGASVGRVGTSVQLGGCIGNQCGKWVLHDEKETAILMMAGISGVFSAFFGTPLAGIFIGIELLAYKRSAFSALLPCALSSIGARLISTAFGIKAPIHITPETPLLETRSVLFIALTAALCGLMAWVYYSTLSFGRMALARLLKNVYAKAFLGGCLLLFLTFVFGFETQPFNGIGGAGIEAALYGEITDYSFLWKLLFTALSLSIGYKGGEVYPAVFIGATLGSFIGNLLSFHPGFLAAIGITALVSGILKAPLTALFLAIEFFGPKALPFYLIAVLISLLCSGRGGIYRA